MAITKVRKELVSIGVANSSLVHPREVFKKAIVNGAKCIITVHNHPGDKVEPSYHDLEIWKKLKKSGEILRIGVMDNIILTLILCSWALYSKRSCHKRNIAFSNS